MIRAEVGGLDNDWIAELGLDAPGKRVAVAAPLLVGKPHIVDHRYAVGCENHLHGDFIHAVCRGKGVAPGVGYANGLEHALEDAVFYIRTVQHGDNDIEGGKGLAFVE